MSVNILKVYCIKAMIVDCPIKDGLFFFFPQNNSGQSKFCTVKYKRRKIEENFVLGCFKAHCDCLMDRWRPSGLNGNIIKKGRSDSCSCTDVLGVWVFFLQWTSFHSNGLSSTEQKILL